MSDELTGEQARGLADKWARNVAHDGGVVDGLDGHERAALFGWVRRECEREAERREAFRAQAEEAGAFAARVSGKSSPPWDANDPEALAQHIATKLGGIFEQRPDLARELVRAATESESS